jgi:hypothetical protein
MYGVSMQDNNCCVTYRINERDEIISVNDDWCRYASDHGWEGISPDKVLHRPIYNYITDSTTSSLYQYLFKRVRGGSSVRYQFNCESSSHRRVMEMTVKSFGDRGELELKARMLYKQARNIQRYGSANKPNEDEFLRACGWCCRIDLEGYWVEVEDAVARLGVFEFSRLPKLTHGICKECFAEMLKDAGSSMVLSPSTS